MGLSYVQASASINPVLGSLLGDKSKKLDELKLFDEFIAPTLNAKVLSCQLPVWDTEQLRAEATTKHAVGQVASKIDLSKPSYQSCVLNPASLSVSRDSQTDAILEQGGWDPEAKFQQDLLEVTRKLILAKHIDLYNLVSSSSYYSTATDVVLAAPVALATAGVVNDTCDIVDYVKRNRIAVSKLYGFTPNVGVIDDITLEYLRNAVGIVKYLSDQKTKIASDAEIMQLFGWREMCVTDLTKDTSLPNGTPSVARVWGAIMLQFYKPAMAPNPDAPTTEGGEFMRTVRYKDEVPFETTFIDEPEKCPMQGGYYKTYTIKQGYWAHKFTGVISSSSIRSTCAGLITGLYS